MSLNFELTKIKNYKKACWEKVVEYPGGKRTEREVLHPRVEAIVFATMSVGLGELTEKNIQEFARRLEVLQAIDVARFQDADCKPIWIDEEFLRPYIGLSTNVSNETAAKWDSRIAKSLLAETVRRYRRARKEEKGEE
jgi:hypothetical protein